MARWLLDTNALLRLVLPDDPALTLASQAITTLISNGDTLCITAQNLVEFWAVATRPSGSPSNGLGLSNLDAEREVERLKWMLELLPDNDNILIEWEKLVVSPGCRGKQAHDARLVAVMRAHNVERLLTFNDQDFIRYAGITVVNPQNV